MCRLEPGTIILTPPSKVKDLIFLKSETNRSLQYQVQSELDSLEINPKQGLINPYQEIRIYLNYTQVQANLKCFKIFVTVGNEQCECLVKIKLEWFNIVFLYEEGYDWNGFVKYAHFKKNWPENLLNLINQIKQRRRNEYNSCFQICRYRM